MDYYLSVTVAEDVDTCMEIGFFFSLLAGPFHLAFHLPYLLENEW